MPGRVEGDFTPFPTQIFFLVIWPSTTNDDPNLEAEAPVQHLVDHRLCFGYVTQDSEVKTEFFIDVRFV